ncbi:hypothetical protein V5799_004127, partial [Amblyomma americanum]
MPEPAEKSGYLTKLGGKLKTWKRRWFVLANGTLRYYKAQHVLRTRQLGACSHGGMGDGVGRPTVDGWVTKVKHGHARRCWGALVGRTFFYYRAPDDTNPLGQIPLRDARVEEVLHLSDSDEDETGADKSERSTTGQQQQQFTVALLPRNQSPTYLLFPTRQEMMNNETPCRSEPGQYASFCGRALERALKAGSPRECRPSRMEVLSILQRNPFHHSLPHSIPVHFLNGAYL